ncbi:MAG: ABC transporter ATP-binding protein [Myxococcaceae bacterium]|nr:ABC transporter ATP-binding protein [Myxococcaceae bacterium]
MIEARGVSRSYSDGEGGALRVLDAVDLLVQAGEFVAVVGRSGSGKSTLLHVVGGLDAQYQGEVTVAGQRLTGMNDAALSRFRNQQVAFVFQSFHLMPTLTVADNVALPAFFSAAPVNRTQGTLAALQRVGLADKKDRKPSQLSGGERQRVAIARALFTAPKVLLCDEPTGNLDAATGDAVIDVFRSLNREGLTILAVTHEERLRDAATRVLTLSKGKLS